MRLLLVLPEDAQRNACAEYFALRGCDVDAAGIRERAFSLLLFRAYDVIVVDAAIEDSAPLFALAERRNPAVFPLILSTSDAHDAVQSIMTVTKWLRLETLLAIARMEVSRRRSAQRKRG